MFSRLSIFIAVIFFILGILAMNFINKLQFIGNVKEDKNKETQLVKPPLPSQVKSITLDDSSIVVNNVSKDEQAQIEIFVTQFESYQFNRDAGNIIASFTPPENKQEQSELDFIEGLDLPGKPMPRLFSTQRFNHLPSAYYIREMKKSGDIIVVQVDELRVIHMGLVENGSPGYAAQVSNLIMEFKKINESYKLSRYYHSEPNMGISKYEGLDSY